MTFYLLQNSNFKNTLITACLLLFWSTSLYSQTQPISPLVSSHLEHTKMKQGSIYGLEWILLGPTLNGARGEAVQADPNKPGTLYAAFGSGGLWKSTNNGLSWKVIFENMPSLGIGDIALAPSNPEIIYVGTGESLKKARNFTMPGTGIYRSSDGGETWSHLGLNDAWHIGEISVHPKNPDVVVVAAQGHFWSSNKNRGIFTTEDGGVTWEHVLYIDENTGANDIVFSHANPNIVYASMWHNYPTVHGPQSGVYKSEDAGKSWVKIVKGINIDENTGRIGVAASYQNPNKAYVFIDQRNRPNNRGAGEIYKTEDGGKNWVKPHSKDISSMARLGWYFMDIHVNPQNDDELYALGVGLIHSEDGGKNFEYIRGDIKHLTPSPAQTLHLDHCEMWINPLNPNELLLANDGGIYQSYDKGKNWLHFNNIPTGEFYDIELDFQEAYQIYGGVQDDATVFGPAKELNTKFNDPWQYVWIDAWSGGDGCITLVDPNDENTIYFSMQNGAARRKNLRANKSVSIRPRIRNLNPRIQYNFITPYMLSPHNSNQVYMAGNYVMKSENRGDDWELISPELSTIRKQFKEEIGAGAMAESPFNEGVIFVGTDRGTVYRTQNAGENWEDISNGLPNNYIRCIYPSKHKKERIYLQQTGINYDDLGAYLFVTENGGNNWKSITSNLPNQPINCILEDPNYENVLYAGTYKGVYVSLNFGKEWAYLGTMMPDASIADLAIEHRSKDLIAATHGRGIYKINLDPFYAKMKNKTAVTRLFDPPLAIFPKRRDTHRDIDENTIQKVNFTYWLEKAEQVKIQVSNKADSVLWSIELDGRKGFNQYRWNLVTAEQSSDQPYFTAFKKYLPVGEYLLKLETQSGILKKDFFIIKPE